MKKLTLAIALTATLFAVSCKKDDPTPAEAPIVGYWAGKYSLSGASYPTSPLSMLYKSNGSIRIYDGADSTSALKTDGTYSVSGNTVTMTFASGGATATIDARNTFQEGTTSSGSKYFLNKK